MKQTILVVDDYKLTLNALRMVLEQAADDILAASDGSNDLLAASDQPPNPMVAEARTHRCLELSPPGQRRNLEEDCIGTAHGTVARKRLSTALPRQPWLLR